MVKDDKKGRVVRGQSERGAGRGWEVKIKMVEWRG